MKLYRILFVVLTAVLFMLPFTVLCDMETEWAVSSDGRPEIAIPDITGYQTLVCDFHLHTVFSDGNVWPTIRVDEAFREGLDAISITDHIEYQPHKDDVPTNHNRSYEIAKPSAEGRSLLFLRGTEITKDTPPGHFNAIFLQDIVPVDHEDVIDSVQAAIDQGGFVFWNHPTWKGIENGRWGEAQETLKKNKWLHGIEVCNGDTYYPEAHTYALEKDLVMMGNSDMHSPFLDHPRTPENHRTCTLVFAKEKTLPALKEALFAGRTAVWYKNQIIGREEYLYELIKNCVTVGKPFKRTEDTFWMEIENRSELDIELQRTGEHGPGTVLLPAKKTIVAQVKIKGDPEDVALAYTVTNFLIAPETGLPVRYTLSLE